MEKKQPLLRVRQLTKSFPIFGGVFRRKVGNFTAVDGVDFSIYAGEILGLVGESGCGKSTTARLCIRLLDPTSGSIEFMGKNFELHNRREIDELCLNMQIVFQDPYASLNPRKSILEAIGRPLFYHHLVNNKDEMEKVASQLLLEVGLSNEVLYRYPHQFSGGQQQRICIARALGLRPKLIICDEVVSALDVSIQAQILNLLLELREKKGLSFLFISHDLSVVRYICDRVCVMENGKIVESGLTEMIFQSPKHPYTKKLLNSIPCDHPRNRS